MAEAQIKAEEHGDRWLVIALDENGDQLAEVTGPREEACAAICEEVRSYLAGEDGWDSDV